MLLPKKLIRLLSVQMMKKECNQLIQQIETHAHGTSKNLVCETEEIKW